MINFNKNYFLIFFSIFFIFSCGGGGGSEPFSLTLPNLSANNNLSLDEDNQYQLTDERIAQWTEQINNEITEILSA